MRKRDRTRTPKSRMIRAPKKLLSPEKKQAMLKVQGRYMGIVRHLPNVDKVLVKAHRREKGFGSAVKFARDLLRAAKARSAR